MRRCELHLAIDDPEHTQHANVDPVSQVLFAQILTDRAFIVNRTDRVILTGARRQPALGCNRGDATEDAFLLGLQLHDQELAMHRRVLESIGVREDDVRMKFEAALAEAAEDPGHLVLGEEFHAYLRSAISCLRGRASKMARSELGSCSRIAWTTSF